MLTLEMPVVFLTKFEFAWKANDLPGLYEDVGLTVDVDFISGRGT